MTDVLTGTFVPGDLESVVRPTGVPGVSIVTSGAPVEHPGELLARGLDLVASARKLADIVIIDTAPLLATDDASVILPIVDDLVLVCKAGRTPIDAAVRTRELLARLEASVVGVVIIGADQLPSSRSYYRTDYRSRTRARQGIQGAAGRGGCSGSGRARQRR